MTGSASHPTDPALEVAERQLAMLGELGQMAMVVSRAYAAASVAAAHAVEVILADEFWQPETGRARALAGAKDAAESFQKVSRALRLTLKLELSTAEAVRDIRAGVVRERPGAAGDPPALPMKESVPPPIRKPSAELSEAESDPRERDFERLVEAERPDVLPSGTFRETVDRLCADLGAKPDWKRWIIPQPTLEYRPLIARPPGRETRPAGPLSETVPDPP